MKWEQNASHFTVSKFMLSDKRNLSVKNNFVEIFQLLEMHLSALRQIMMHWKRHINDITRAALYSLLDILHVR